MKNKIILICVLLSLSLSALADECTFHVEHEVINYEGYPFGVGAELRKIMLSKGYKEAYPGEITVEAKFKTFQGAFFQWAETNIQMTFIETQELAAQSLGKTRCITQLCSIWDVQKSIQSALKEFVQQIPDR